MLIALMNVLSCIAFAMLQAPSSKAKEFAMCRVDGYLKRYLKLADSK